MVPTEHPCNGILLPAPAAGRCWKSREQSSGKGPGSQPHVSENDLHLPIGAYINMLFLYSYQLEISPLAAPLSLVAHVLIMLHAKVQSRFQMHLSGALC